MKSIIKNIHINFFAPRFWARIHATNELLLNHKFNKTIVAEVGCGNGIFAATWLKTFNDTKEFDIFEPSQMAIKNTKAASNNDSRIKYYPEGIDALAEKNNHYDSIFCFDVIEHLEQDMDALLKIHASLKPNASLLLSVPCHSSRFSNSDIWAGHYRRYNKKELYEKLQSLGYTILDFYSYGYPFIRTLNILSNIFYSNKNKKESSSQQQKTLRSGTSRTKIPLIKLLYLLILPLLKIQSLFKYYDVGDGYIVIAQKK